MNKITYTVPQHIKQQFQYIKAKPKQHKTKEEIIVLDDSDSDSSTQDKPLSSSTSISSNQKPIQPKKTTLNSNTNPFEQLEHSFNQLKIQYNKSKTFNQQQFILLTTKSFPNWLNHFLFSNKTFIQFITSITYEQLHPNQELIALREKEKENFLKIQNFKSQIQNTILSKYISSHKETNNYCVFCYYTKQYEQKYICYKNNEYIDKKNKVYISIRNMQNKEIQKITHKGDNEVDTILNSIMVDVMSNGIIKHIN